MHSYSDKSSIGMRARVDYYAEYSSSVSIGRPVILDVQVCIISNHIIIESLFYSNIILHVNPT